MSLDVYLEANTPRQVTASDRIFIREDGQVVEVTLEEWYARNPGRDPVVVHDDGGETTTLYTANITHNLNTMAAEAEIYRALWIPDEIGIQRAHDLIPLLEQGLALLKADPPRFQALNPVNGWGNYGVLVGFVADYLAACKKHPTAKIKVWR